MAHEVTLLRQLIHMGCSSNTGPVLGIHFLRHLHPKPEAYQNGTLTEELPTFSLGKDDWYDVMEDKAASRGYEIFL